MFNAYNGLTSEYQDNQDKDQTKLPFDNSLPQNSSSSSLCSIVHKNNSQSLSETPQIICQNYLSKGNLIEAYNLINAYVDKANHTFFILQNRDIGKYIVVNKTTRFSPKYTRKIRKRLSPLTALNNQDTGHFTLTVPYTSNSDYISALTNQKYHTAQFIKKLDRKFPNIPYLYTFEATENNGLYHMHIHLIIFGLNRISSAVLNELKEFWFKTANADYLHYNFIPKGRNINALNYVLKYVLKETDTVNLTSALLFSVKGRAYTINQALSKRLKEAQDTGIMTVNNLGYRFYAKLTDPIQIFDTLDYSDFDPTSLARFLSLLTEEQRLTIYKNEELKKTHKNEELKKTPLEAKEARKHYLDSITFKIS